MPVSTWHPNASSGPHHDSKRPNGASTRLKTAHVLARRKATNPRWAAATCGTVSGVASIES